jgi:Tfp pilus assembly protein PilN
MSRELAGFAGVRVLCCALTAAIVQNLATMSTQLEEQQQINLQLLQQMDELQARIIVLDSVPETREAARSSEQQQVRRLDGSPETVRDETFIWLNVSACRSFRHRI